MYKAFLYFSILTKVNAGKDTKLPLLSCGRVKARLRRYQKIISNFIYIVADSLSRLMTKSILSYLKGIFS